MELKRIFIDNLKKYRDREHLSQMKLAERCETAASYIGEIEIGRKFPSIEMIEKIASALHVKPHSLFLEDVDAARTAYTQTVLTDRVKKRLVKELTSAVTRIIEKA
ncbi:MAG: helix-turn-helix domain-containing protein [Spirochaetales bacterium]|jgi:transcriptional regulator with XRE-family HTH domain|nr:helix-turn-helix domain-containing protein [Spirochaetales bacterium]